MAQTKRFTIEASMKDQTPAQSAQPDGQSVGAEDAKEPDVTLEDMMAAVARVVRDELSNWQPPAAPETTKAPGASDDAGENPESAEEILFALSELQKYIATSRSEIAALKSESDGKSQFNTAKMELQEIVDATANATNDILNEAEAISGIQASLAEKCAAAQIDSMADELSGLENASMQIMLACGFQDLTGQRINKVVNTLIFVEERINKLLEVWNVESGTGSSELKATRDDDTRPDKDLLNGPQADGEGISQDDIDAMFA
ncbi:MAG: protein phosphatase CheZ [Rhodospirillales bacterium]|jgi:chemotaxis regulatin CheY-phosphate phosphatase CheZ|nr:protein phosphatase CheZ [Rhodospirillales bacterium]